MNTTNINSAKDWFSVLQTGQKTQTALMTLKPGASSAHEAEAHDDSEQVLLVLAGEVMAELEGERRQLKQGDTILIPAGTPHKFTNESAQNCVTFNTYSPPEY